MMFVRVRRRESIVEVHRGRRYPLCLCSLDDLVIAHWPGLPKSSTRMTFGLLASLYDGRVLTCLGSKPAQYNDM